MLSFFPMHWLSAPIHTHQQVASQSRKKCPFTSSAVNYITRFDIQFVIKGAVYRVMSTCDVVVQEALKNGSFKVEWTCYQPLTMPQARAHRWRQKKNSVDVDKLLNLIYMLGRAWHFPFRSVRWLRFVAHSFYTSVFSGWMSREWKSAKSNRD